MIPFSPPRIDDLIINEVIDTLKSGWITTGPKTLKLEQQLTEYCGCDAVVCLNSATAGLELVLRWFGVGPGDEVIIPAYTYCATANVVEHVGAKPIFVDTDRETFNIDLAALEKAITPRTKVIMPVDIGGLPCRYNEINHLVRSEKIRAQFVASGEKQEILGRILVLADAAHSFGASLDGKKQGSLTDISVFSFHAVKNLTTAEGGAVAFNLGESFEAAQLVKTFKTWSLHGQSKDAMSKLKPGAWRYDVEMAGYKCNMTDISAAIGLVELSRYDNDTLVKRKAICQRYEALFAGDPAFQLPVFEYHGAVSSYHLYQLRIIGATEEQRDRIIVLISEQGISVNVHFIPVPLLTYYREKGYLMSDYPVTYDSFSREISLPVFYDLTDDQVVTVADAVKSAVKQVMG